MGIRNERCRDQFSNEMFKYSFQGPTLIVDYGSVIEVGFKNQVDDALN